MIPSAKERGDEATPALIMKIHRRSKKGELISLQGREGFDSEFFMSSEHGAGGITAIFKIKAKEPIGNVAKVGDIIIACITDYNMEYQFIIKNISFACSNGGWSLVILGNSISYHMAQSITIDYCAVFEKPGKIPQDVIQNIIDSEWSKNQDLPVELMPWVARDDVDRKKIYYDCFSSTGGCLHEIIDNICFENNLEYYYNVHKNRICIGDPAPATNREDEPIHGIDDSVSPGNSYVIKAGDINFIRLLAIGDPKFVCGLVFSFDDKVYKVIKSTYSLRADGEAESVILGIEADITITHAVLDILSSLGRVHDVRKKMVRPEMRILDVNLSTSDEVLDDHAVSLGSFYKFADNMGKMPRADYDPLDPRKWKERDSDSFKRVIISSPFAGNGVGLMFPMKSSARHLTFSPGMEHGYAITGPMVWREKDSYNGKEGDIIPECEPEDFYLRLDNGYLYFDKANKTWLLRAKNVKLEAAEPITAATKPDTTPTSGTYIKISDDGTVIVEGTTVKLGKNASKAAALADHVHKQTWFTAPQLLVLSGLGITPPFDITTLDVGSSSSNTTKTKAE